MTAAATLFLDTILQLEAEGWLRGFLDALVAAGRFPLASVASLPVSLSLPEPQPPPAFGGAGPAQRSREVEGGPVSLGRPAVGACPVGGEAVGRSGLPEAGRQTLTGKRPSEKQLDPFRLWRKSVTGEGVQNKAALVGDLSVSGCLEEKQGSHCSHQL